MLRHKLFSDGTDKTGTGKSTNNITKVEEVKALSNPNSMLNRFLSNPNTTGAQSAVTQHWGSDWKKANAATNPGGSSVSNAGKAYGDAWKNRIAAQSNTPANQPLYRGGSSLADAGYTKGQDELAKEFNRRFAENWDPNVGQNDDANLAGDEYKNVVRVDLKDIINDNQNTAAIVSLEKELTDLVANDPGSSSGHGVSAPTLRSAMDMANLHGIDYDMDNMRALLDEATEKQYANLDTEFARNQRDFYNMSARSADDLSSALMTGDRAAAMTGATRGSNLASQIMALQASADLSSQGATELAQGRTDLIAEREAALAENAANALTMYNELGINLATMSARELEALAETYAADVGYEATMEAARVAAQAQKYASLQNRLGLEKSAATSAAASKYGADSSLRMLADPNYQLWAANQKTQ